LLLRNLSDVFGENDISWDLVYSARQNAEAGKVIQAHKTQDQVIQRKLGRNQKMVLALSLARSGRTDEAERLRRFASLICAISSRSFAMRSLTGCCMTIG